MLRALGRALVPSGGAHVALAADLRERFAASDVLLTDSGTSALVVALRILAGVGGTVALPAWACIDLTAAATFAGVRVRLYDIDPQTLSPDLDSLQRALVRGVDVVLVAHLYGYPADLAGVAALTDRYGVPLLEDAAQGAGGWYAGKPLGSFGAMSVLSFGRGKGVSGGGGGALLARSPRYADAIRQAAATLGTASSGASDLARLGAQFVLGRPALYGLPARIPALRLGEMVYHPAREPRRLSRGAAVVVRSALALVPAAAAGRSVVASTLQAEVEQTSELEAVRSVSAGTPGYLRLPVRDPQGVRQPAPSLGILRGYPMTLAEHEQLRSNLLADQPPCHGASELARSLFTLPTHHFVDARDVALIRSWIAGDRSPRETPSLELVR
jgi:hypothetical protein